MSEPPASSGLAYAYKASLVGSAHQFALEDDAIVWQAGRRSGRWRYADVVGLRMSYRPMSMQTRRFRTDIEHRGGERIVVMSTTWQTVTLMVAQDRDYRAFILELHQRIAAQGHSVMLAGGINPMGAVEGYKPASDEALVAAAPEVVVMMIGQSGPPKPETVFDSPALRATPAAKDKALVAMDGLYLLGFGPRTADAARDLAHALYPSLDLPDWPAAN